MLSHSSILLVASKSDIASMNILNNLTELVDFEPTNLAFKGKEILFSKKLGAYLLVIDDELIRADYLEALPSSFTRLIFLSRHSSQSKLPSLLVHFPGNWTSDNSMGGKPRELSVADPEILKKFVMKLLQYRREEVIPREYEVGIEVTHHGPTINRACTFIEIGSDIENWKDSRVGMIVAKVIVESIGDLGSINISAKIGFGGPHYAPKFLSVIIRDPEIFIGHIAPKYVINELDEAMIRKAIERSMVPIDGALLDWKGLNSKQRKRIMGILEEIGLGYIKI